MEHWVRGGLVGRGSFATVNLVLPTTDNPSQNPPTMVVKSSEFSSSDSLSNDKKRGSLADQLKRTNCFTESDVRRYTNSILRGLCFIHKKGFAHCDIKLQNILLFENGATKIANFGFARRVAGEKKRKKRDGGFVFRGTPLYISPEVVNGFEDGEFCVRE
ncbi:hypothetical protein Ancab_020521 [Ancistrocladus abbreviatus]